MQMWSGAFIFVLCAVTVSCLEQVANQTTTSQPLPQTPAGPDMSALPAAVLGAQAQQQMSKFYGTLLLEYQTSMGWMQFAQAALGMIQAEAQAKKAAPARRFRRRSLEEDEDEEEEEEEDEEEMVPLMLGAGAGVGSTDRKALERSGEMALLTTSKMLYLQASNKLQSTQDAYYAMKVMLGTAQASGANLGPMLWIMYYREVLRVMSSAVSIQRQDTLNTYALLEIAETDADRTSPKLLASIRNAMEHAAMTWHQEASLDLQMWFLDYYLSMYGVPSLRANNNAAASFLEEESTAEPSKPFFSPGTGVGVMSFLPMMNFYSIYMGYAAAQSLASYAHIKNHPELVKDQSIVLQGKTMAYQLMYQWGYIKFFMNMMTMYAVFTSMSGYPTAHNNMAMNSLLQTNMPVMQQPAQQA